MKATEDNIITLLSILKISILYSIYIIISNQFSLISNYSHYYFYIIIDKMKTYVIKERKSSEYFIRFIYVKFF
jgi:hypothetical protein